jgi:hypothetical protein
MDAPTATGPNLEGGGPSVNDVGNRHTVRWTIAVLAIVALIVWLSVAIPQGLDKSRSASCSHNLAMIGMALRNYSDRYGTFPPAYLCDKSGKPVNSWRTRVIPSFWYNFTPGRDDYAGGSGYDYGEPWNGPKNAGLCLDKKRCWVFQCPSGDHAGPAVTDYVAVVGPGTMWPGCKPAKPAADGSDRDKILVIEVVHSDILWMEPRDLTLQQALAAIQPKSGIGIGSHHGSGIRYVTVGGAERTLDPNIDRESLRRLLVRDATGEQKGRTRNGTK